jgi:hypothetical protein
MLLEGLMGGQIFPYGFVSACVFGFEPRDSSSSMTWFCMQLGSTSDVEHHVFSQTEGLATRRRDGMSRQDAAPTPASHIPPSTTNPRPHPA